MKKLFKTFLTIVIIFALVIIFTFAVVSIRMTGQVKALTKQILIFHRLPMAYIPAIVKRILSKWKSEQL